MVLAELEKINLGIPGLDKVLEEGLPKGSSILVAGNPGTGKTTFGAQFIYYGLLNNEPGIYIGFIEPKVEFLRHMESLGLNFKEYEKQKMFKYVYLPVFSAKEDINVMLKHVLEEIYEINAKRVVIDTISSLENILNIREYRGFLHSLIMHVFKPSKVTSVLIAELPLGAETIGYRFEEFIVDAVFILRMKETKGLIRRIIEIRKIREKPIASMELEYIINKGGIKVYISFTKGLLGGFTAERISTGIKELDKMFNGGVFKGSIILIAGPSGTGKTMISMVFALVGAINGEKVVYISFEEPCSQLYTLINSLGYNFESLKENIRIYSFNPRLFTPAALYHTLRRIIEEFKPSRVIIDGLSALERHFEHEEFSGLVRSIVLFLKSKTITTVTTILANVISDEHAGISTVSDVILALWFDMEGETVQRKITILKARGTAHDKRKRILDFKNGKIVII